MEKRSFVFLQPEDRMNGFLEPLKQKHIELYRYIFLGRFLLNYRPMEPWIWGVIFYTKTHITITNFIFFLLRTTTELIDEHSYHTLDENLLSRIRHVLYKFKSMAQKKA